jgi:hypothetical protein
MKEPVAMGAAAAANCHPCMDHHLASAATQTFESLAVAELDQAIQPEAPDPA